MNLKVLVTQWIPEEVKNEFCDKIIFTYPDRDKGKFTRDEVMKLIPEYDALFTIFFSADKEVIEAGKKLKVIANLGVGYDSIDVFEATKRNIAVINTPNAVTEPTSELTIALMMSIMRRVNFFDKSIKDGLWLNEAFENYSTELFGSTLGIVGFGRIGKSVCKKAQALGMIVRYYDTCRLGEDDEKNFNVEYMDIDDIFTSNDCVTIHIPYTEENHNFVDEKRLSKMKKDSYFINVSRGAIVKESALVEALKKGVIKGAGLDVFEYEPKVGKDLIECKNTVLTPHVGTQTYRVRVKMSFEALTGILAVLEGEMPYNLVNKELDLRLKV